MISVLHTDGYTGLRIGGLENERYTVETYVLLEEGEQYLLVNKIGSAGIKYVDNISQTCDKHEH